MKILMGSSYFMSHRGGLEIVAGMLFKEFSEQGQEVVWMAGDVTPPPEPAESSRTVSFRLWNFVEDKTGLPFPIPSLGAARKIMREVRKADVLLLHDCLYLSNIFAFLVAKWRGIPTVVLQHTRFFPNDTPLVNAVIKSCTAIVTRPMLSRASQVVFFSEITRQFFREVRFRTSPEVIFNGVDTDTFRTMQGSETARELRREFGLREDGVVILFVGRFVEKKGIHALQRMAAMRPGWTWAFAGWGPIDPTLWNLANVRVLTGLRGATLAPLYRCCEVLVLPSTGEGGLPLVIQEALASGLPVVCGEETLGADPAMGKFVTAAPTYPEDYDRTAREFLAVIDETLANESTTVGAASARRSFVLSRYSWHSSASRYLEILRHLAPSDDASCLEPKQSIQSMPQ